MTKNLLKSLLLTIIASFSAIALQAQCYIIGNDGNWVTNQAGAQLQPTSEEGVYEGDVTFSNNSYWFFVATQLTEEADDWSGILPYRYNPATIDDQPIIYNTPTTLTPASESVDASFRVADLGTHKIRVDLNAKTMTVDGTYPEYIYMMGTDNKWELGTPSATLTRVDGTAIYKASVEFTGNWFAFFTQITDSWDTQNEYRWATTSSSIVLPNTDIYLANGAELGSIHIERLGTYEVSFNYTTKVAQLYDPTYEPEPINTLYFIGDGNSWQTNTSFATIEKIEEGVYKGEVTFPVGYFAIGTTLSDDWATFNANRLCPAEDGEAMSANTTTDIYNFDASSHSGAFQIIEGDEGTYTVTVDLNQMKLSFAGNATAISNVNTTSTSVAPYYDICGRCIGNDKPSKGIYIRNGKKVAIK